MAVSHGYLDWMGTSWGLGRMCQIHGNMDANLYTQILDEEFLPTLDDLGIIKSDIYFQQDNDPKHTSKLSKLWFKKKKVDKLDWPPSSPDMNIIEHIWDYLDRRVRTRNPLPTNVDQMWAALWEAWCRIEQAYIDTLYESMPERVQALIKAKGGYPKS